MVVVSKRVEEIQILHYSAKETVDGFVLFASSAAFTLFRRHLIAQETQSAKLAALHRQVMRKSLLGLALYGVSVPLALVSPWISIAIFAVVPAMFFLPDLKDAE